MKKKYLIWREILESALNGQFQFVQEDLAKKFKTSTSMIYFVLKVPREIGVIEVRGRFFRLIDFNKFLELWATHRNIMDDWIYKASSDLSVDQIESSLPQGVIFTGFSAYKQFFHELPADYDSVMVYETNKKTLDEIKKKFPSSKDNQAFPRLLVYDGRNLGLGSDHRLPLTQLYVDLWGFPKWYVKDYLTSLKLKIDGILSKQTN